MKIKNFVFASALLVAFLMFVPQAKAHNINFFSDLGYWGGDTNPILSCTGGAFTLNPNGGLVKNEHACDVCELIHTATHIAYFILSILVFIIIPLSIMWGGLLILTSQGSSEKIGEGKKVITGALMGVALGLGAYLIVNTFLYFLAPTVGGTPGWGKFSCEDVPEFLQPRQ